MKIDKATLIKHRFWVLLGVFVPLTLFAILWLETAVEGAVEEVKKKIADHRGKLEKNASQAKLAGQNEMNLCKQKEDILGRRKEKIWQEAWDLQQGLIFWPPEVNEAYADIPFGQSVSDSVRTTYARSDVYLLQYETMGRTFQVKVPEKDRKTRKPVVDPKTGKPKMFIIDPVQFEGGWQKVLHPIEKWKVLPPSDEEVWLAQEDVWVRHELLEALKEANGSVARYKRTGKNAPDQGPPFEQTFENPYWKIELSLYPKEQQYYIKGKITNIGKKRLALGRAFFWLQVQREDKEARVVLPVEGESRAVGESWEIKETQLDLFQNPAGLFGLEQIFETRTVPVRRIDDIVLCYHSHRTYEPLLAPRQFGGGKPAAPPTTGQPKFPPPPGGNRPQPAASGTTPNGVATFRYTDVTDQVRRMPLALVLIADQAHIPEVLTALSNSKLRMQITQVNWQHFRGTLEDAQAPRPKEAPRPLGPPRGAGDARPVVEEPQNNLVELSIYGIASLYEMPGKKIEGETGKTPAKSERPARERKRNRN